KTKAYFSWSEGWRPQGEAVSPGGFAFAALQIGQQRFGFFSVQKGAGAEDGVNAGPRAAAMRMQEASLTQLLEQISLVSNWATNRIEAFVVGATFDTHAADWAAVRDNTLRLLEVSEFENAFRETPTAEMVTVAGAPGQADATADYLLTRPAGCAANP